jgi:pimeloyl-ACP methyl ester carboxylesterase
VSVFTIAPGNGHRTREPTGRCPGVDRGQTGCGRTSDRARGSTGATNRETAAAFNNPDYVSIVIGNYRWRQSRYPSEPEYAGIETKLQQAPTIAVPTITIDGAQDPFTPPGNGAAYRDRFTGTYDHRVFDCGHNVPQEAPRAFARAVMDADRF